MIQLSVIIPYYNVSAYIERCARSLMEQTKKTDIEYIFVNDGSTDDSAQILQRTLAEYSDCQDQCKMISISHAGVSAARKRGMEEAKGEYLIHCDADDWVEPTAYQSFCDKISQTHADVIVCPFFHEFSDHRFAETYRELPIASCFNDQRWWSLCSHAVRRSLIERNNIFPLEEITFWEDIDLLMRVFVHAQTIAYLPDPLYHYDRTHEQSSLHQHKRDKGFLQCQLVIDHLTAYFNTHAPQHLPSLHMLKHSARDLYLEGDSPDCYTWSRTYPEVWPYIWRNHSLSLTYRICYVLGSFHIIWPMQCLQSFIRKRC